MNLWLPTIPYSLIDCINRVAAATGSPRYAMANSATVEEYQAKIDGFFGKRRMEAPIHGVTDVPKGGGQ